MSDREGVRRHGERISAAWTVLSGLGALVSLAIAYPGGLATVIIFGICALSTMAGVVSWKMEIHHNDRLNSAHGTDTQATRTPNPVTPRRTTNSTPLTQ